jgi:hypothetical protein
VPVKPRVQQRARRWMDGIFRDASREVLYPEKKIPTNQPLQLPLQSSPFVCKLGVCCCDSQVPGIASVASCPSISRRSSRHPGRTASGRWRASPYLLSLHFPATTIDLRCGDSIAHAHETELFQSIPPLLSLKQRNRHCTVRGLVLPLASVLRSFALALT